MEPSTEPHRQTRPEYGFYRLYNYNFSLQASTIVYGRYEAKKKTRKVQAIRHDHPDGELLLRPDFSKQKYGYLKTVQSDTLVISRPTHPSKAASSACPAPVSPWLSTPHSRKRSK